MRAKVSTFVVLFFVVAVLFCAYAVDSVPFDIGRTTKRKLMIAMYICDMVLIFI